METPLHPLRAEKPGRSPANRSLERGLEILRAFRPGSGGLANGEIAERTGLSRATVSRLTQTLVAAGLLQLDGRHRAYRLAPAVLTFAHAMRTGSALLAVAAPRMRALAERERVNVGLAAPDRDEMVYLESIRYNRRVALRQVASGQRVPMELTSLGRAYLAVAPEARRQALFRFFRRRRGRQWAQVAAGIAQATRDVAERGYCAVAWQPSVVAVSTPLDDPEGPCVLNVSVSTAEPLETVAPRLGARLLALRAEIEGALEERSRAEAGA